MVKVLDLLRLDDKVAIVTEASSGLGVSFATASLRRAPASSSPHDGSTSLRTQHARRSRWPERPRGH